jgi:hypothetical protein
MKMGIWALAGLTAAGTLSLAATAAVGAPAAQPKPAQAARPALSARQIVDQAAEAMGGKARLQAVKTLKVWGYGQGAYQDGAGHIDPNPLAPFKYTNINEQQRWIDLEHNRMHVQQRNSNNFVMSAAAIMTGAARPNQNFDGSASPAGVSWNVAQGAPRRTSARDTRARRVDMLGNPLTVIRTALDPRSKLSNARRVGNEQVIDMVTPAGDAISFAVDARTHLPAWMRWTAPHPNFGDVTYTTHFIGYQRFGGWLQLPSGYTTISDFRNVRQTQIYIDQYQIDASLGDLAAPAAVASAATPPDAATVTAQVIPVAKGIWYIKGAGNSTLFEFADHTVLFEAYGSEASALAVIKAARATVPNKPLTHVVLSHYHIDHTGGLRAAVSEGLTMITNRANADYVREVTGRTARMFPDALERSGRKVKVEVVDDHMVLQDATQRVDLYKVINNNHYANGLIAWSPTAKTVSEGDLVDEGWDIVWLGDSYPDTVAYWKLDIQRDLPVHGNITDWPKVIELLKKQAKGAQALCERGEKAGLNVQGCPLTMTMDKY